MWHTRQQGLGTCQESGVGTVHFLLDKICLCAGYRINQQLRDRRAGYAHANRLGSGR